MNHLSHGAHALMVQSRATRPRGPKLQGNRPRGVHARRDPSHGQYDYGPHGSGFVSHTPSGPCFPIVVITFPL
jgi:hypothetical protein